MENRFLISDTLAPYYEQLEKLLTVRDEFSLEMSFINKAVKLFINQYFFELKYIFKVKRKVSRREYRKCIYELLNDKQPLEGRIQAVEITKQVVETVENKTQPEPIAEVQPNNVSKAVSVVEVQSNSPIQANNAALASVNSGLEHEQQSTDTAVKTDLNGIKQNDPNILTHSQGVEVVDNFG